MRLCPRMHSLHTDKAGRGNMPLLENTNVLSWWLMYPLTNPWSINATMIPSASSFVISSSTSAFGSAQLFWRAAAKKWMSTDGGRFEVPASGFCSGKNGVVSFQLCCGTRNGG